jgi:hypothetical protein
MAFILVLLSLRDYLHGNAPAMNRKNVSTAESFMNGWLALLQATKSAITFLRSG